MGKEALAIGVACASSAPHQPQGRVSLDSHHSRVMGFCHSASRASLGEEPGLGEPSLRLACGYHLTETVAVLPAVQQGGHGERLRCWETP